MDFMSDELFDGRRIRVLTIVDHFSRESPAILVDGSLGGRRVALCLHVPLALHCHQCRIEDELGGPTFLPPLAVTPASL